MEIKSWLSTPVGVLIMSGLADAACYLLAPAVPWPQVAQFLAWVWPLAAAPGALVVVFGLMTLVGSMGRVPLIVCWRLALGVATLTAVAWMALPLAVVVGAVVAAVQPESTVEPGSLYPAYLVAFGLAFLLALAWGLVVLFRMLMLPAPAAAIDRQTLLEVYESSAPELFRILRRLCGSLRVPMPRTVMLSRSLNFFVTREHGGRTLVLSAPAMTIFTVSEFTAVLGHELAHLRAGDLLYSERFFRIYRHFQYAVDQFENVANFEEARAKMPWFVSVLFWPAALAGIYVGTSSIQAALTLVAWPICWTFNLALQSFAMAERRNSRIRELQADRVGASLTQPGALVSALVKIHAAGPVWSSLVQTEASEVDQRIGLSSRYDAFMQFTSRLKDDPDEFRYDRQAAESMAAAVNAERKEILRLRDEARSELKRSLNLDRFRTLSCQELPSSMAQALLDVRQTHPMDSHPPLHQRLAALAGGDLLSVIVGVLKESELDGAGAAQLLPAHTEWSLPLADSPF